MKIGKALTCSLFLCLVLLVPAIAQVTVTHTGSRTNDFSSGGVLATLDFSSLPDSSNTVVFFIYCFDNNSGTAYATFDGEGMYVLVTDRVALGYLDNPSSLSGDIVLNAPVGGDPALAYWGLARGVDIANIRTAVGTTISGGVQSNATLSALSVGDIVYSGFAVNNFAAAAYSEGLALLDGSSGGCDAVITTDTVPSAGDFTASTSIDPAATVAPGGISIAFTEAPSGNQIIGIQDFEAPGSGIPFSFVGEDTDISDATAWSELSDLSGGTPAVAFTGFEGSDYVYGQHTSDATNSIILGPVDLSSVAEAQLWISLAAGVVAWDGSDNLVVKLDKDNDGSFETTLIDFHPIGGSLAASGYRLETAFQDLRFFIPEAATQAKLRIDLLTSSDPDEAVGIDDIRIIGRKPYVPAGTVIVIR